jgi:hypothetical protein
MISTIIGVDPGANGAIAVWSKVFTEAYNLPETRKDAIDLVKSVVMPFQAVAYIEKISGFIPDGGASQMFEFGKQVERIGCILETLGVPIFEITPQAWHKELSLGSIERTPVPKPPRDLNGAMVPRWKLTWKKEIEAAKAKNAAAKREFKNKLKAEAQRRFPHIKVTLKNCDALLILEAGKQIEGRKLL